MSTNSAAGYLFIDEGFEAPGYIAARAREHPELRFRFKPMIERERKKHAAAYDRLSPDERAAHDAKMLSERVTSWDVPGRVRSPETFIRLHPEIFVRLVYIVMGFGPSDEDPASPRSDSETVSLTENKLAAAATGSTFGDVQQAAVEKN